MSHKLIGSIIVWAGAFFLLEIPAVLNRVPWLTLSSTVTGIIKAWPPEGWLVLAFMAVLYGHFDQGWSWKWLVVIAGIGLALYLGHLFYDVP